MQQKTLGKIQIGLGVAIIILATWPFVTSIFIIGINFNTLIALTHTGFIIQILFAIFAIITGKAIMNLAHQN